MTTITVDEWLDELARLSGTAIDTDNDGMSCAEITSKIGVGKDCTLKILKKAIAAGQWECVRGHRMDICGRNATVPLYRPIRKGNHEQATSKD